MIIFISGDKTEIEWNLLSTIVRYRVTLPPAIHILVSDIVPTLVAWLCTSLTIYMNGYVGVLDLHNMQEVFVAKRAGGKIRTEFEHAVYELDQLDSDREFK